MFIRACLFALTMLVFGPASVLEARTVRVHRHRLEWRKERPLLPRWSAERPAVRMHRSRERRWI